MLTTAPAAPRCDQIISRVTDHHDGDTTSCADQIVSVTLALYPHGAAFDGAAVAPGIADALAAHPHVTTSDHHWRISSTVANPDTCSSCHLTLTLTGDCPLGC